jgi:hypothetical protein
VEKTRTLPRFIANFLNDDQIRSGGSRGISNAAYPRGIERAELLCTAGRFSRDFKAPALLALTPEKRLKAKG